MDSSILAPSFFPKTNTPMRSSLLSASRMHYVRTQFSDCVPTSCERRMPNDDAGLSSGIPVATINLHSRDSAQSNVCLAPCETDDNDKGIFDDIERHRCARGSRFGIDSVERIKTIPPAGNCDAANVVTPRGRRISVLPTFTVRECCSKVVVSVYCFSELTGHKWLRRPGSSVRHPIQIYEATRELDRRGARINTGLYDIGRTRRHCAGCGPIDR